MSHPNNASGMPQQHMLYRTRMCRLGVECNNKEECQFAHGPRERVGKRKRRRLRREWQSMLELQRRMDVEEEGFVFV